MNEKHPTPGETGKTPADPRHGGARPPRDPLGSGLPLPHERDQAPDPGDTGGADSPGPRQVTEQAARDIARGLRDTDRGIPTDVPGPGAPPQRSPGAEVPPEGVDRTKPGKGQRGG